MNSSCFDCHNLQIIGVVGRRAMGSRLATLVELWESTQVELHGRYTTDRVLELAKYSRETSWVRIAGVLLATPLPCLAVTVLSDVLPLASPAEGVNANYMFIIREFYCYLVMNFLAIQQFRTSVPLLPFPTKRVVRTTTILSSLCVGVYYGYAQAIGFPVPFSIVAVMPTWVVFISASIALEWKKKIGETPGSGTMVLNVVKVWMCQVLLVLIYPPYFYVFTTLSDKGQTGFALLLPAIKILMRNVFIRTVVHLRDELPEVVIFNVEVFNALFVAYCMQNSPSIWTTLLLMLADVVLLGLSLRDVELARHGLEELEHRIEQERTPDKALPPDGHVRVSTTLERASAILRQEGNSQNTMASSPVELPRKLSSQGPGLGTLASVGPEGSKTIHKSFAVMARDAYSTFALAPHPLRAAKQLLTRGSVLPVVEAAVAPGNSFPKVPVKLSYTRKVRRLLYMAEFVLLLNYVEVIIPLVFCKWLYARMAGCCG
jgi:hypothetical protein